MRLIAGDHDCDSRSQLGNVTVFCEIAQVFRGIVGAVSVVGSAGPVNNDAYDDRLRSTTRRNSPPDQRHLAHPAGRRSARGDDAPSGRQLTHTPRRRRSTSIR